ncbi:hypothetical protein [Roseateles sp. L2-2]|uniref:hypothetical protein n=1 Tax=Roseateles sp. L2-2 TaxID=3422597 RepID=UPI003D366501
MAGMASGSGQMGWAWPGRGMFRVQTTAVHADYASDYAAAPANRKDIFEGSVNQHWKAGVKVRQSAPYAALKGATVVPLDTSAAMSRFSVGGYVLIAAANTRKMFVDEMGADCVATPDECVNGLMKSQMFKVVAVDAANRTLTLDKPLEFDLNRDNVADGSTTLPSTEGGPGVAYYSKAVPLQVVRGVGFSNLYAEMALNGLPKLGGGTYAVTPANAIHNYGNLAPEYAMHGIVFKWAADAFVRDVKLAMTGSHPIVTEFAKNIQVQDNAIDGAWNKGKGGNGYMRGSKVWDSLYAGNRLSNVRHFTFQWAASGNEAVYKHLETAPGAKLADWGGSETLDYAMSPRNGVNSSRTDGASASLFLVNVSAPAPSPAPAPAPAPAPTPAPPPAPAPGQVEVKALLNQDDSKQTKYNLALRNLGTAPLANLKARVYVDVSELLASNRAASTVVCEERSGTNLAAFSCSALKPHAGNVYYAELDFGSHQLAAGATLNYNITLRLSDWAQVWNASNDYSHAGLNASTAVLTSRIPVFSGNVLVGGANP